MDNRLDRNNTHTVFAGDSELAVRMRAIDWSTTPLGSVDDWPQSLKTCVRIVLTSRQPMFVWWGDSLINLYNDAYKAIVGGKHPAALGQPAAVVWREIWDQVGPRAETTMRGSAGTYDEALLLIMERHGYQEETYYTFSYSPVPNDSGGTGGLICANTDDTRRIIGERQMALLRDLAACTADARTLEAVCDLCARLPRRCCRPHPHTGRRGRPRGRRRRVPRDRSRCRGLALAVRRGAERERGASGRPGPAVPGSAARRLGSIT